jgi:hypothetical protein
MGRVQGVLALGIFPLGVVSVVDVHVSQNDANEIGEQQ